MSSLNAWLAVVEALMDAVPVYRLGFHPQHDLWSFLDNRQTKSLA